MISAILLWPAELLMDLTPTDTDGLRYFTIIVLSYQNVVYKYDTSMVPMFSAAHASGHTSRVGPGRVGSGRPGPIREIMKNS